MELLTILTRVNLQMETDLEVDLDLQAEARADLKADLSPDLDLHVEDPDLLEEGPDPHLQDLDLKQIEKLLQLYL